MNTLPLDWALPVIATLADGTQVVLTVQHSSGGAQATVGADGSVVEGTCPKLRENGMRPTYEEKKCLFVSQCETPSALVNPCDTC